MPRSGWQIAAGQLEAALLVLNWTWVDLAQLLLATFVGVIVGFKRELNGKPAGTTTITLVTICSTLVMQLGFKLPAASGGVGVGDPTRLAAGVITGIGFLGAGTIIRRGGHVDGLTSAATIWIMSAVGLAIGAGYYVPAAFTVALILAGFFLNTSVERVIEVCRKRYGIVVEKPEVDEQSTPFD